MVASRDVYSSGPALDQPCGNDDRREFLAFAGRAAVTIARAASTIRAPSWTKVVKSIDAQAAAGMLSKPATITSSGIRIQSVSRKASIAPMASRSFAQNSACAAVACEHFERRGKTSLVLIVAGDDGHRSKPKLVNSLAIAG